MSNDEVMRLCTRKTCEVHPAFVLVKRERKEREREENREES